MPQVLPHDVSACPSAHGLPPGTGSRWLRSRARRAFWHTCLLGLLVALPACDREGAGGSAAAAGGTPKERVARLVELFTPLAKTVTSDKTDAQFIAGQELLAQLSAAGPEVGRAAL